MTVCLWQLRDALARIIRASEALQDGDLPLAEGILDDLAADLWAAIERGEREAA